MQPEAESVDPSRVHSACEAARLGSALDIQSAELHVCIDRDHAEPPLADFASRVSRRLTPSARRGVWGSPALSQRCGVVASRDQLELESPTPKSVTSTEYSA